MVLRDASGTDGRGKAVIVDIMDVSKTHFFLAALHKNPNVLPVPQTFPFRTTSLGFCKMVLGKLAI